MVSEIRASPIFIPVSVIRFDSSSSVTLEISTEDSLLYNPKNTESMDLNAFSLSTVTFAVSDPSAPLRKEADFIIVSSKKTRLGILFRFIAVSLEKSSIPTGVLTFMRSFITSDSEYIVPSR